jgi:hypothetical protein
MSKRFRLDPSLGRFTVQAFVRGLLSFLGHSPTFAVRDFPGWVQLEEGGGPWVRMDLSVPADALTLVNDVSPGDRVEIEGRMRREVLETAAFPEITYRPALESCEQTAAGHYRVCLAGPFSLHGVTRPLRVGAELTLFDDGVRLRGETSLRMSDHGIRPVTVLAGAIKLRDELKVAWDLGATPEGP